MVIENLIWNFAIFYDRPSAVLVDLSYNGLLQPALAQQAADDYRVTVVCLGNINNFHVKTVNSAPRENGRTYQFLHGRLFPTY